MRSILQLCFLFFILGISSCDRERLHKSYSTFYAESLFTYNFNLDGTFSIETSGHIGQVEEAGVYAVRKGTVALFFEEEFSASGNFQDRFYIKNTNELVDKSGRHYWADFDNRQKDWRPIINKDDQIKAYLTSNEDYRRYFKSLRLDTMAHVSIITNGVLKSSNKVLDVYSVSYYNSLYQGKVHPYPLHRYIDFSNGEVWMRDENDKLMLDTILTF